MHSAQNFGANNFVMTAFLGSGSIFYIFLDRGQLFHEKGRRESSEALDHCILHGISVRIQWRGRFFASSHLRSPYEGSIFHRCFAMGPKKSSKKKVLKTVTARLPFRGNFALSLASPVVGPRGIENGPKWAEKCSYLIAGYVG